MIIENPMRQAFLETQIRDYGGRVEIDTGLWTLFAVPAADTDAQAIARDLLAGARFFHDSGVTDDDQWMLFYVDTANRNAAMHWLNDQWQILTGGIRPPSPAQLALFRELTESNMPHRVAQTLIDQHARA